MKRAKIREELKKIGVFLHVNLHWAYFKIGPISENERYLIEKYVTNLPLPANTSTVRTLVKKLDTENVKYAMFFDPASVLLTKGSKFELSTIFSLLFQAIPHFFTYLLVKCESAFRINTFRSLEERKYIDLE